MQATFVFKNGKRTERINLQLDFYTSIEDYNFINYIKSLVDFSSYTPRVKNYLYQYINSKQYTLIENNSVIYTYKEEEENNTLDSSLITSSVQISKSNYEVVSESFATLNTTSLDEAYKYIEIKQQELMDLHNQFVKLVQSQTLEIKTKHESVSSYTTNI